MKRILQRFHEKKGAYITIFGISIIGILFASLLTIGSAMAQDSDDDSDGGAGVCCCGSFLLMLSAPFLIALVVIIGVILIFIGIVWLITKIVKSAWKD